MPRLFGTDGIRGIANVDLKPTIAYALGRATAHRLVGPGGAIVVGQDTRRSGDMFVAAIVGGRDEHGRRRPPARRRARRRPSRSWPATGDFAAGIMVSASHNPADDNGLKVLDAAGLKLDDDIEDELEALIWRSEELGGVGNAELGRSIDAGAPPRSLPRAPDGARPDDRDRPADRGRLRQRLGRRRSGRRSWPRPGRTVEVIHNDPDGVNINVGCGATAPAALAAAVARARRRHRLRPRRRRRPARRGRRARATSSTATRSWASSPSTGSSGARSPTAASSSRSSRTAGSRRPSRRPAGRSSGPRSATSTSSRACRSRAPAWAARRAAT